MAELTGLSGQRGGGLSRLTNVECTANVFQLQGLTDRQPEQE